LAPSATPSNWAEPLRDSEDRELIRVQGAFTIERATPDDFADLVAMRHLEDWAPNAWLFSAIEASHLGHIVVARWQPDPSTRHGQGRPIAASAVGTAYGALGVIGNVIVHASHRARGLGRAVMEAELAWLRQRGISFVELDATEHGRPLYEKLGFIRRAPSWMMVESLGSVQAQHPAGVSTRTRELTPATLECVAALDRQAFGGNRIPLLAAVLARAETRAWVALDAQERATGYLFVRPTEHRPSGLRIGPWIAQAPRVALDLLRHAVSSAADATTSDAPVVASVPGADAVVMGCFEKAGIPLVPDDVRMRLTFAGADSVVADCDVARADWVYGMLAPMVG
jgi:GNAT superfamily N-acetyltransferase